MNVKIQGCDLLFECTILQNGAASITTKDIIGQNLGKDATRMITRSLGGTSGQGKLAQAPLQDVLRYLEHPLPLTASLNEESKGKFWSIQKNDVLMKLRCSGLAVQEAIDSNGRTKSIVFKDFCDIPNALRVVLSSEGRVDIVQLHREHMNELVASMEHEEAIPTSSGRSGTKRARSDSEEEAKEGTVSEEALPANISGGSTAMIRVPTPEAIQAAMERYCPKAVLADNYFSLKVETLLGQNCTREQFFALIDGFLANKERSEKMKLENDPGRLEVEKMRLANDPSRLVLEQNKLDLEKGKFELERMKAASQMRGSEQVGRLLSELKSAFAFNRGSLKVGVDFISSAYPVEMYQVEPLLANFAQHSAVASLVQDLASMKSMMSSLATRNLSVECRRFVRSRGLYSVHIGLKRLKGGLVVVRLVVPESKIEVTHDVVVEIERALELVDIKPPDSLNGGRYILKSKHLSTEVNKVLGLFLPAFETRLSVCRSHEGAQHESAVLSKALVKSEGNYCRKLVLHVCDRLQGEVHGALEPTAEYAREMRKIEAADALVQAITGQLDVHDAYKCPLGSEFGISTVLSLTDVPLGCRETRDRLLAEMTRLSRSEVSRKYGIKIRTDSVIETLPVVLALPDSSANVPLAVSAARLWSVQLLLFRGDEEYRLLKIVEPLEKYLKGREFYDSFSSHLQIIAGFKEELEAGAGPRCRSSRRVCVGSDEHYARELARAAGIPVELEQRRYASNGSSEMWRRGEPISACQYQKQMSLKVAGAVLGTDCELVLVKHVCEEHKDALTILCRPGLAQARSFRALVERNTTIHINTQAYRMPIASCLTGVSVGTAVYINCANTEVPLQFRRVGMEKTRYAVMERKKQGRKVFFVLHQVHEEMKCSMKMATLDVPAAQKDLKKWVRIAL